MARILMRVTGFMTCELLTEGQAVVVETGIFLPSRQFAKSTTFYPRDARLFFAILAATDPMCALDEGPLCGHGRL